MAWRGGWVGEGLEMEGLDRVRIGLGGDGIGEVWLALRGWVWND